MAERSTDSASRAARSAGPRPARRRAHLNGRYFALSWERPAAAEAALPAAAAGRGAGPMMAVPKKLVPSAPLRNTVRRVLREAVRAARIDPMPATLVRLVALPCFEEQAPPAAPTPPAAARRRPPRPFDRRLPDGAFKRACRADADALLDRLRQALAAGRRG